MFKMQTLTHVFSSLLYCGSASFLPPKQQHGGIFEAQLKVLVRIPRSEDRLEASVEAEDWRRLSAADPPPLRCCW